MPELKGKAPDERDRGLAEVQLILQAYLVAKTVQHRSYEAMRAPSVFDLVRAPLYKEPWGEIAERLSDPAMPTAQLTNPLTPVHPLGPPQKGAAAFQHQQRSGGVAAGDASKR